MKQTFSEHFNLREWGRRSENFFQPGSSVAGMSGSSKHQNTVFKQSHPYRGRRVFTAGQTWTYMRTMFILVNTPFMQDKHTPV